jgi:hypothetical protein
VISVELARQLRAAGLAWRPAPGDRFVVVDRGMDDDVFVLANMTIDVHNFPTGPVIGFNGTTEWALDSLEQRDALWLPSEQQLRDLLGARFARLLRVGDRYQVVILRDDEEASVEATTAPDAYGLALLQVLREFRGARPASRQAE